MSAAAIAVMVRELRPDVMPGEQESLRAAAKWAVDAGFAHKCDLAHSSLACVAGWDRISRAANALLVRAAASATVAVQRTASMNDGLISVIKLAESKLVVKQLAASSRGPRAAIAAVARELAAVGAQSWHDRARVEALCGSSQRSLREVASVLRCWSAFAISVLNINGSDLLPPTVDGLLLWSRTFAVKATFSNYLGKLRLVCEILRLSTASFDHRSLARAKATIQAVCSAPRLKHFARRSTVAELVKLARMEGDLASAMLYVVAYAFLLRVPSEALPLVLGGSGVVVGGKLPEGVHSCLCMDGDVVRLQLARRKHKPHGSTLMRGCWCVACKLTCPVHVLAPLLRHPRGCGRSPFVHLLPSSVIVDLRRRLAALGVASAGDFDTRCFRRGHTEDLRHNSSNLGDILAAGEWSSSRFMEYLHKESLEDAAVMQSQRGRDLSSDSE